MIAYVTGTSMKPDATHVQVWKRFRNLRKASDWINETYWRLATEDRTLHGLLSHGILLDENKET